jgi:hypothetical protein
LTSLTGCIPYDRVLLDEQHGFLGIVGAAAILLTPTQEIDFHSLIGTFLRA